MNKQGLGSPNRKLPQGSARSYVRFAALGDSATAGVGDRADDSWRGWARLLADSMAASHDVSFCNAAVPGATAAQVRTHQLAIALEHRPHLASLVVGINDVLRADWDAQQFRGDLLFCADRLGGQGAVLATVRFHDHGRVFGLPRPVRGFLTRRINEVNKVYDEILARWDGIQLDLGDHPAIYDREFWCRDRLHPSELGHRAIARKCAELLRTRGLAFEGPALELDGDPTNLQRELRWAATEATPWLWRRALDVTIALARPLVTRTSQAPALLPVPSNPARCDRHRWVAAPSDADPGRPKTSPPSSRLAPPRPFGSGPRWRPASQP